MDDCISTLTTLDSILAKLRLDLEAARQNQSNSSSSSSSGTPDEVETIVTPASLLSNPLLSDDDDDLPPVKIRKIAQDYTDLRRGGDMAKAKRLINARESAIKAVRRLLEKAQTLPDSDTTPEPSPALP